MSAQCLKCGEACESISVGLTHKCGGQIVTYGPKVGDRVKSKDSGFEGTVDRLSFMSEEMWADVLGDDGISKPIAVTRLKPCATQRPTNALCDFCRKGHEVKTAVVNGVTVVSCPNLRSDESYVIAKPSPRARDHRFSQLGARESIKCNDSCFREHNQQHEMAGRILNVDNVYKDLTVTKTALAVSEKERERLKGEVDAGRGDTNIMRDVVRQRDALMAERDTVRRELENLKRGFKMEHADMRSTVDTQRSQLETQAVELNFLQRELDRERAKNKKRGL